MALTYLEGENIKAVDGALYFTDSADLDEALVTPTAGAILFAKENSAGVLALFARNSAGTEVELSSGLGGPAVALTYAATVTPAVADGAHRKVTLTGNMTLNAPTGGYDGALWKARLTASGADRTLTVNAAVLVPTDNAFNGTQVIPSGKSYLIQLEYWGSAWHLTALSGAYL